MKLLVFLIVVLAIDPINDLTKIARINENKKAAREAYEAGDYQKAITHYSFLVDSLQVRDESVLLNLANSLYKVQDTTAARNAYSELIDNSSSTTRSKAYQQMGLMDYHARKYEESLNHFKNSLKADPSNEKARYNYELLKKLVEEQKQNQEQQQNQDQENEESQENQENQDSKDKQDQQQQQKEQEQQDQEQEEQDQQDQQQNQDQQQQDKKGEEKEQDQPPEEESDQKQEQQQSKENEEDQEDQKKEPTPGEKLEEMNISEEKAKMILEALKNNEIQYLQQNKRKATQRKKSGKPDW